MTNWPQISIDIERGYSQCFGCGQDNPIGLKLSFQWDGQTARAEFTPTELHQGWPGMVHGGIIICLLDEAMGYAGIFDGVHCLTAKIQVNLKRPTPVKETLIITSSIIKKTRKLIETRAVIAWPDGTLIAEGRATQFVVRSRNSEERPGSNVDK